MKMLKIGFCRFLLLSTCSLVLLLAGCSRGPEAAPATANQTPEPATESVTEPARRPTVRVLRLVPRRAVDKASLPAELAPLRRASLAAEAAGTVVALHADEGSRINRGKVLMEIDARDLQHRLAEAEAVHRQRQAQFQRGENLLASKSITQQQFLDALTNRDVAVAQLERLRLELQKTKVKAPWIGTVAKRLVEVGDYVVPGQVVFELLDVRRLKVRAPVPAADIPYLKLGTPTELRLDPFPGEVFQGRVSRLAPEVDADARTLDIELEIANADGRLRPGMYARLEIPRQVWDQAILVPLASLVEIEEEKAAFVIDGEGDTTRVVRRELALGPTLGQEVVVLGGLEAGDRLVVEGQRQVSPGQLVVVDLIAPERSQDVR